MKNEQRIWNLQELQTMSEWSQRFDISWFSDKSEHCISESMIGKTVQWCEDQGYIVKPEMIATERLDKGECITLENGNPSFEEWLNKYFAKPKMKLMYKTFYNGKEYSEEELIKRYKKAYQTTMKLKEGDNIYTDPKEEPKPLEVWNKTMDLRWKMFFGVKGLQQKQISNLGNEKWVDIETVVL